jgi:hypothetical protein
LQNQVFDMVSIGQEFKLWISPKDQFVVGNSDVARPPTQPLENLQPQVIYDALLLQAVDLQNELAVLEDRAQEVIDPGTHKPTLHPEYMLNIIKQDGNEWYLSRKVVFDRTDLRRHQELFYDEHGFIVTDVRYDDYREFNGLFYPTNIQIRRPLEECSIKLEVMELTINDPIVDGQFVLEFPSGAGLASR